MHPPDELMVGTFLPSMRLLVARRLRSLGYSQGRISRALGVTQASVSHYLSADPARAYGELARLSVGREEADRYAGLLSEDVSRDAVYSVETLTSIWTDLLATGKVCTAHRDIYPSLSTCDVCLTLYGPKGESNLDAVSEVAEAVRTVERSRTFAAIMPEVSVNLACLPSGSNALSDVVAVPGRISKVKGFPRATFPPERGASHHLARILLLTRSRDKSVRACMNIRYDGRVSKAMRRLGLVTLEIGGYPPPTGEDTTVRALGSAIRGRRRGFKAVVDKGGQGIEPNVYLFGGGAMEVVKLALRISEACSAG